MFKDDGIKGAMADLGARIVAGTVNPGSAGSLTPEEAKHSRNRNLITRAVGTEKSVECDLFKHDVKSGESFVLCSDGLTNHVEPFEICDAVADLKDSAAVQSACESLIDQANKRGGLDNITVVVLSI